MNDERHLKTWNDNQSAWAPIEDVARRDLLQASVSDDVVCTDPVCELAPKAGSRSEQSTPCNPLEVLVLKES